MVQYTSIRNVFIPIKSYPYNFINFAFARICSVEISCIVSKKAKTCKRSTMRDYYLSNLCMIDDAPREKMKSKVEKIIIFT